MKKLMFLFFSTVLFLKVNSQNNLRDISIIPIPVTMKQGFEHFQIKSTTAIEINLGTTEVKTLAQLFSDKIKQATGFEAPVKVQALVSKTGANIRLVLIKDAQLKDEGYKLIITPLAVSISANTAAGLFYRVQTFYQLLPKQVESKQKNKNITWSVPVVSITDYPRFKWRGLMLDATYRKGKQVGRQNKHAC